MSELEASWASLASRVIRVALERKAFGYASLTDALSKLGVAETERSLIARVSRGTYKFTLLLQVIEVTDTAPPVLWRSVINLSDSWERRAASIFAAELAQQPWVSPQELSRRLATIGVNISERTLASHLSAGTLSMALFVQCVAVLRSSSLDSFLDFQDILAAAKSGAEAIAQT